MELAGKAVEGFAFAFVADIVPQRATEDVIHALLPQSRYANVRGLPLNNYGAGPFCKFVIPRTHRQSGVYLIMSDDDLKYVGECANLSARFNAGYGNISPKKLFQRRAGNQLSPEQSHLRCDDRRRCARTVVPSDAGLQSR